MARTISWRRNQFAVAAAAFMGFTGFTLVMPFLPLYIAELGVTDVGAIAAWAGFSLGVTPAITAVLSPFWGRVADRFGRKLMVERSLVSFVVIMAAMAYVTEAWHIFALRAVQGLFAGYGGLTLAMAAESAPKDRLASAIGTLQTVQRLGPALGPVIGGVVAGIVGLRQAFLVTAVFYAIAFILVLVLYENPPASLSARGSGAAAPPTMLALVRAPGFLFLMAAIAAITFVDRSFGPVLPLYVQTLGLEPGRVVLLSGWLFSIAAVTAAFGNQACPALLRWAPTGRVIGGGAALSAAALILFLSVPSIPMLTLAFAAFGAGIGTATTAAYTAGAYALPPGGQATGFGFLTGAGLAGLAISPVVAGLLARTSLVSIFLLDLALLALAVVMAWMRLPGPPGEGARFTMGLTSRQDM
jgi:DHA1 family multidrug resistance protein-like MFS transporter